MLSSVFNGSREMRSLSIEAAVLPGFRLAFNEPGIPFFEPAFANIVKDNAAECEGVLYRITAEDLIRLDFTEGRGAYDIIDVSVIGRSSGPVMAKTFKSKISIEGLLPTQRYMALLIDGARERGLSSEWIQGLENQTSINRSMSAWLTPFLMKFATVPLIALRNIRIARAIRRNRAD